MLLLSKKYTVGMNHHLGNLLRLMVLCGVLLGVAVLASTAIAAPSLGDHCAVDDAGTLTCWGDGYLGPNGVGHYKDLYEPEQVGATGEWVSTSGDSLSNCGIKTDGSLWCWGSNRQYQLADGTTQFSNRPKQIGSDVDWQSINVSGQFICGVKDNGLAYCWGEGSRGELGNGANGDRTLPTAVMGADWAVVETGQLNACGLKQDGSLWCWGDNTYGQFGNATYANSAEPVLVDATGRWSALSVGNYHACGIQASDDSLWCWGSNYAGQIGNGTASNPQHVSGDGFAPTFNQPELVAAGTQWQAVDASQWNTCGVQMDNTLWCWGRNDLRQAGPGDSDADVLTPQLVSADPVWETVEGRCAMNSSNAVACWGDSDQGELGVGRDFYVVDPQPVVDGSGWIDVASGYDHGCAVNAAGELWCWGEGWLGTMGDGQHRHHVEAERIGSETDWATVAAGETHVCAQKTDDTLWCWGRAQYGQRGDDENWYKPTPQAVAGDAAWQSYSTAFWHGCGIQDDQSLWCWGRNNDGQLGQGTVSASENMPQPVQEGATWSQVTIGKQHSCGLQSNGTLWCWGDNDFGQVGNGTTLRSTLPSQVGVDDDWVKVSAADQGSCALKQNGTLWCWGDLDTYKNGYWQNTALPKQHLSNYRFTDIEMGRTSLCGITANQETHCWGFIRGHVDQVGDLYYHQPRKIPGGHQFTQLDIGDNKVVGLTESGEVLCWQGAQYECGQGVQESPTLVGDYTAPFVQLTATPRARDTDAGASFAFTANEAATFECQLDNGIWEPCTSPHVYPEVTRGTHTFAIRAIDENGNTSEPTIYIWEAVETSGEAPETIITAGPTNTDDNQARFEFVVSEPGAISYCRMRMKNGAWGVWEVCTSPKTYSGLADGKYEFEVYSESVDGLVEAEPARWSWRVSRFMCYP